MIRIQNTNVRTQKFLTMKNFNNASLKTKISAMITALFVVFMTTGINAQVGVTIDSPMDGDVYCAEFGDVVTFDGTAFDGGFTYNDNDVMWSWAGPLGWSSTLPNPDFTFDDPLQGGDYRVTVTFGSGVTASDTVSVTVDSLLTWECPSTIIVTPDLDDPDCAKNLIFDGFQIDAVNCTSLAYTWDLTLTSEGGVDLMADPATLPMSFMIDNTLFDQTYGAGVSYLDIPFGFHELRIDILSGSTIYEQCLVEVQVVESRGNLACNDLINMTLDGDCSATITPDMILEGEYCFDLFGLEIESVETGNIVTGTGAVDINDAGMYNVTVTGQTGISCWGQILAEDKTAPILDCEDVEMYCSTLGTAPGDEIRGFDRGWVLDETVGAMTTEVYSLNLVDIEGDITEVLLNFHAQIEDVSQLELWLTSPAGTRISLLDLDEFSEPCTSSNINVCLEDRASNTYGMFGSPELCRNTQNALIGSFRPKTLFSTFNSEVAVDAGNYDWELEVVNNGDTDLVIVEADLQVYTVEGFLLSATDVVESNGCSDDFETSQSTTFEDEQIGTNCESGYWQHIIRTWRVTNAASGLSASCEQNIFLKQWTVDEIIWPKSYDDLDQPAYRCDDLLPSDLDDNNVVLPSKSGMPRVPFGDLCGNFQVTHNDLTFDICGPLSKKTIRTWSVLDWCTGDIVQRDQIIKVVDDEPIVFSCVPDNISQADADAIGYDRNEESYIVRSNPYTCDGNWEIVFPLVFDNACDDDITMEVYYLVDNDENPDDPPVDGVYIQTNVVDENGVAATNSFYNGVPHEIRFLPVGRRTWIKMVATDECGNTGECFTEVDVVDRTKPIPVCIEYTVVAFGEDGEAKLHAESLDNGSWDNCGVVEYELRDAIGSDFEYTDTWTFGCNCDNPNRTMYLRVTDAEGNFNTCEVEVELQDNLPPVPVSGPQPRYVFDCSQSPVDLNGIIDESLTQFEWADNCLAGNNNTINISVSVIDNSNARAPFEAVGCGEGSRTVNYEVIDECGDILQIFSQRFEFENNTINQPSTFSVTSWPQDLTLDNCEAFEGLEPYNLGGAYNQDAIRVNTSVCNDIAIGWDDTVFPEVQDGCLKILREWTVIDWCIANRTTVEQGTRKHTQVIKINDLTAPNIDVTAAITIESKSQTCFTSTDTLALVADITDACTDMFDFQEIIYYYNIEYPDGTTTPNITGMDANGSYPFGTSIITWYAEDHCGNVTNRETRVIVRDTKKPTPYCLGSVVTATMNTDGTAEIWASDFDLGGTDNYTGNGACNNFNELDVYFLDGNIQTDFLIFDCDDIPNGISQIIALEVYYEDEYGNTDFCIVNLNLQDNQSDMCEDVEGSMIAGNIHTESNEAIENVRVNLTNNVLDFVTLDFTDEDGNYAFENVPTNTTYTLSSSYEDTDPLNGVSTLDVILIQRHVLGLEELNSPFKLIAADADNSGNISAIDLLTIRKLILGVTEQFPNGQQSWRFPTEDQVFLDSRFPFPYSEEIDVFNMQSNMMDQDFMAVKIGDVNGSAKANATSEDIEIDNRSNNDFTLTTDDMILRDGDQVKVPFYGNGTAITGFQNTFAFNSDKLELVSVESGALDINDEHIGMASAKNGILTMSWNTLEAENSYEDEVLFELVFIAKSDAQLSEELYLNSNFTKAEAYDASLQIMEMNIDFRGSSEDDFVLYQNVPNPFLETTDISFRLPKTSDVLLTVFDVTGRVLLQERNNFEAGIQTIRLHRNQLNSTGVMYYKIETDFGTDSRKMIQIR